MNNEIAKVRVIRAYKVEGNHDCEGRGPNYIVGYFANQTVAYGAAKGVGSMGSQGDVEQVSLLEITYSDGINPQYFLNKPIALKAVNDQEIREAALSKLTDEEKRVLGVK